jgi:hypothetical protein
LDGVFAVVIVADVIVAVVPVVLHRLRARTETGAELVSDRGARRVHGRAVRINGWQRAGPPEVERYRCERGGTMVGEERRTAASASAPTSWIRGCIKNGRGTGNGERLCDGTKQMKKKEEKKEEKGRS